VYVEIITDDQGHSGSGGPMSDTDTVQIWVNPDDITSPEDQVTHWGEHVVFSSSNGNEMSISDVDSDLEVKVTLSSLKGTLKLFTIEGLTFSEGDGIWDSKMIFRGSVWSINAALDGLKFKPTETPPTDGYVEGSITMTAWWLDEEDELVALINEETVGITIYDKKDW
jgi:hypothetical protein